MCKSTKMSYNNAINFILHKKTEHVAVGVVPKIKVRNLFLLWVWVDAIDHRKVRMYVRLMLYNYKDLISG